MRFDEIASPIPGMRCWIAGVGRFHFVIAHEDGSTLKPEDRAACDAVWRQLRNKN